ncbi:MAG: hypothetical protein V3V00_02810 [Saprospiraceae bacterium]
MNKLYTFTILVFLAHITLSAQTPNTLVQYESSTKGILLPNVDSMTRKAMAPTANETSLLVYDTDLKNFNYWNDTEWKQINSNQYVFPIENNVLMGERVGEDLDFDASPSSGRSNTFIGDLAGLQNTTGERNTFIGAGAGRENINGKSNTYLGLFAGGNMDYGLANVAIGDLAAAGSGGSSDSLTYSVVIGSFSLPIITSGTQNVFIGQSSGAEADSVYNTVVIGSQAGRKMSNSVGNTFVGSFSGHNTSTGNNNTFMGTNSGLLNTTGSQNAFFGFQSGFNNTTGKFNTFIGDFAGLINQDGDENVYVGKSAGVAQTGNKNIMIGRKAGGFGSKDIDNSIFIGYAAGDTITQSNKLVIESGDPNNPLIYGDFADNTLDFKATVTVDDLLRIKPTSTAYACNSAVVGSIHYFEPTHKLSLCTETGAGPVFGWVELN